MAQKPKGEARPRPEAETKVKVVVPNRLGEILVLTRSPLETTRPGQPDLPGGSIEKKDGSKSRPGRFDLQKVIRREAGKEEMPGTVLDNIWYLGSKLAEKREDGVVVLKTSIILGATAVFPETGIVLGPNGDNGFEHVAASWLDPEEAAELEGLPNKYRRAIAANGDVIAELAALQEDVPGNPRPDLAPETVRALGVRGLLLGQETPLPQGDLSFRSAIQPAVA